MQIMRWLALLIAISVVASCFYPWMTIESKHIMVGGFHATTNVFGKPGIFHTVLVSIVILFVLVNKNWSARAAFFISAFNIAWALRNYVRLSACEAGLCPEKQPALYLLMVSSLVLPIVVLFIRGREKTET